MVYLASVSLNYVGVNKPENSYHTMTSQNKIMTKISSNSKECSVFYEMERDDLLS